MALQVEIWVKSIIEGLFANNTFAARSVDHSEFVNEKTVHVPNAGAAPNVEKNRTVFPANVTERKDVDLIYQMDEFTVDPVRIPHAEQVELSYNKRESVTRQSRKKRKMMMITSTKASYTVCFTSSIEARINLVLSKP